jgi:hypothetical protein
LESAPTAETPQPAIPDLPVESSALPFERHLREALADSPAAVAVISEGAAFRLRQIREPIQGDENAAARRPRAPVTHIMVAAAAAFFGRFLR